MSNLEVEVVPPLLQRGKPEPRRLESSGRPNATTIRKILRIVVVLVMNGELYNDTYRVASARLRGYDYGQNGAYFVTVCTRHRTCFFGDNVLE